MNIENELQRRGATIVNKETADSQTRFSVVQTCLNELYSLRRSFDTITYVGVRGDHFVVDVCDYDHDTRDNATFYGGDPGHDFYHCDGCGERLSFTV